MDEPSPHQNGSGQQYFHPQFPSQPQDPNNRQYLTFQAQSGIDFINYFGILGNQQLSSTIPRNPSLNNILPSYQVQSQQPQLFDSDIANFSNVMEPLTAQTESQMATRPPSLPLGGGIPNTDSAYYPGIRALATNIDMQSRISFCNNTQSYAASNAMSAGNGKLFSPASAPHYAVGRTESAASYSTCKSRKREDDLGSINKKRKALQRDGDVKSEAEKDKTFLCEIPDCGLRFGTTNDRDRHFNSKHHLKPGSKYYICPQMSNSWCEGRRHPRKDNFLKHLQDKHNINIGSKDPKLKEYEHILQEEEVGFMFQHDSQPSIPDNTTFEGLTLGVNKDEDAFSYGTGEIKSLIDQSTETHHNSVLKIVYDTSAKQFDIVQHYVQDPLISGSEDKSGPTYDTNNGVNPSDLLMKAPTFDLAPPKNPSISGENNESAEDVSGTFQVSPSVSNHDDYPALFDFNFSELPLDGGLGVTDVDIIQAVTSGQPEGPKDTQSNENEVTEPPSQDLQLDKLVDLINKLDPKVKKQLNIILSGSNDPNTTSETRRRHQCPKCSSSFAQTSTLRKHITRHEKPYVCFQPGCLNRFGSKNDWQRHDLQRHNVTVYIPTSVDPTISESTDKSRLRQPEASSSSTKKPVRAGEWCGFCKKCLDKGEDYYTHVEAHLLGKRGMSRAAPKEWIPRNPGELAGVKRGSISGS